MKSSTPTSPKPRQPPSFLFIGPPGGGKSTALLQLPGLAIADCDLNLNGPERLLREDKKLLLTYKYETIPLDDSGKPISPAMCWDRVKKFALDAVADPEVKIIALDGLTQINTFLIEWVLKTQGKTSDRATMEIQDWVPFRRQLLWLIMTIRMSGKWSVLTCHENIERDKMGSVEKYIPAVSTNLRDYFGGLFTDMWRFTSTPGTNNTQHFWVKSYATATSELKNSFGIPSREVELPAGQALEVLSKWVKWP